MQQTLLAQVILPAALFFIMLGMGLSLVPADFKRVLEAPRAAAVGIACQMLFLPIVAFAIVMALELDPRLAVGLMVLSFCPGGTTSNMLSYLSRGDVALSISLTAVVSLVTPFTIPLLTALSMRALLGSDTMVSVPIGETMIALLVITIVPVALGMAVRRKWPSLADRTEKPVKWLSVLVLVAIIAGLIKQNAAELPGYFVAAGAATLLLNVVTMTAGFFAARFARLGHQQQVTIGIEVGIQNGTTALMVTGTLIGDATMTIAPAIYSLIMFVTGGLFGVIVNRGRPREATVAPA